MGRPRSNIQQRIVHAARRRFLREGVDGASVRSIAKDARTNVGMISYYFPTKDDLFFAVVEELYTRLLDAFAAALGKGDMETGSHERLRRLYRRIGQFTADEVDVVRLVVREVLVSSARFERLVRRFLRGHIPLLVAAIDEGRHDGTLSAEHHPLVMMVATMVLAGPGQLIARALPGRWPGANPPTGAALSDALLDVLMRGIASDRRPHPRARRSTPSRRRTRLPA